MEPSPTLVALLHGPDQPGLVARVAGWIFARGGNILHADQHRDMQDAVVDGRAALSAAGLLAPDHPDVAAALLHSELLA